MKCVDELELELRKRLVIKSETLAENDKPLCIWTSVDKRITSMYIIGLISSIITTMKCSESSVFGIQGMNDNFILIKVDFSLQEVTQLSNLKYSKRRSNYE